MEIVTHREEKAPWPVQTECSWVRNSYFFCKCVLNVAALCTLYYRSVQFTPNRWSQTEKLVEQVVILYFLC